MLANVGNVQNALLLPTYHYENVSRHQGLPLPLGRFLSVRFCVYHVWAADNSVTRASSTRNQKSLLSID